jgi:hypothetical protein
VNFTPQAIALGLLVGLGFGYAAFGLVTVISNVIVGQQLWWLEWGFALVVAALVTVWFSRLQSRQSSAPRADRGERAIWRLSYRRGRELSLEQIVNETLLDEVAALNALHGLESQGQAERLENGSWRLLEPQRH